MRCFCASVPKTTTGFRPKMFMCTAERPDMPAPDPAMACIMMRGLGDAEARAAVRLRDADAQPAVPGERLMEIGRKAADLVLLQPILGVKAARRPSGWPRESRDVRGMIEGRAHATSAAMGGGLQAPGRGASPNIANSCVLEVYEQRRRAGEGQGQRELAENRAGWASASRKPAVRSACRGRHRRYREVPAMADGIFGLNRWWSSAAGAEDGACRPVQGGGW